MGDSGNEKVLAEIFSAAGRYILEGGEPPRLTGDPRQVEAIRNATIASRRFYEALNNKDASLDTIVTLNEDRKLAASRFEKALGTPWKL